MDWTKNIMFVVVCSFVILMVSVWFLFLLGCDIRNNALIREQSETFEKELRYRQKTEIELSNKLQVSQERIAKLEKQLQCREQLVEEEVDQVKRNALRDNPIIIE